MRLIVSNIIPFRGYIAVTVWPLIFVRKSAKARFTDRVDRHECIHGEQQKELLPFGIALCAILWLSGCGWWSLIAIPLALWLYLLSYLVRLVWHRDHRTAYHNIPFEQEAYMWEDNDQYLSHRRHFAWISRIFKTRF